MNIPIFITVHGFVSNKPFIINANTIERLNPVDKPSPHTELFMCGCFEKSSNSAREPNYKVKESLETIQKLIKQAAVLKP